WNGGERAVAPDGEARVAGTRPPRAVSASPGRGGLEGCRRYGRVVGEAEIVIGGEEQDAPSTQVDLGGRPRAERAERASQPERLELGELRLELPIDPVHRAVMPGEPAIVNLVKVNG